jgi:sterol desaturase/sphingolipid hydroxylase (fatty acid hydroxylase superfamily)
MSNLLVDILNTPIPYAAEFWDFVKSFTSSYFWAGFFVVAIVPMIWFYVYGAFFYMIDFHTSEEFKYKYKVQNNIRITFDQFIDAFNISFRNWVVLGLPYLFMVCKYNEYLYEKNGKREPVLPTVGILLRDLVVYVILEEVMFYFSHRALHWNSFYASIHKFHHKFTAPCAIASVYAHPIEHMLSNVIPVAAGNFLKISSRVVMS